MKYIFAVALLCVPFAYGRDRQTLQSGTLLEMDSVECATDQKSAKSFAGKIGTDNAHHKMHTLLCEEYLL